MDALNLIQIFGACMQRALSTCAPTHMKKAQQTLLLQGSQTKTQPVLPLLLQQHHRNHHQVPTTLPGGHLEPPLPDKKHQQNQELVPAKTFHFPLFFSAVYILFIHVHICACAYVTACIFSEDTFVFLILASFLVAFLGECASFIVLCSKTINSSENQLIDYIRTFCNKVSFKNLKTPFLYIC